MKLKITPAELSLLREAVSQWTLECEDWVNDTEGHENDGELQDAKNSVTDAKSMIRKLDKLRNVVRDETN